MQTAQDAPKGKLVVVIDDDPVILEAMGGLLRSWGYHVVTAASEDAALAHLSRRPDLIICDYRLADGKIGIQAIERIRDAFEVPALLITAEAAPARSRGGRATRYDLLHKPVDPTALQSTLCQMLKRKPGGV